MNGVEQEDSKPQNLVEHVNIYSMKRTEDDKQNGVSVKRKRTETFEFGNYNRYYGYRVQNGNVDPRLDILRQRLKLFKDKDILDIGCNIGHITYSIARDFFARSVLGIDIDNSLIQIARKNLRYYNSPSSPAVEKLLQSFEIDDENPVFSDCSSGFPNNVSFLHVNYVLYSDDQLIQEQPKYDIILCLSVTKWIHLNWGDEGLKRSFKRMFLQLRLGGALVLEAQPFESYKKKKLSAKLRENCRKLTFLPHMFDNYLLNDVGFLSCETLSVPSQSSLGFQRPIQLFFKS
ncbi:hypothetical protein V9T40_008337 [Parthenolecanium corni]|uniref:RNA methyltransferase n=1 Tax=Parthenolecanium corni TaxID=536013 RepID=A0AAN9TMX4_9HEMI